tara:strand:- start:687 stop:869 length:183 start_codon:yes stop_codon:yes gene_type:complete
MAKFYWKKKKTIAMYLNKRQAVTTQGNPNTSIETEVLLENGNLLVVESSTAQLPNYIITE